MKCLPYWNPSLFSWATISSCFIFSFDLMNYVITSLKCHGILCSSWNPKVLFFQEMLLSLLRICGWEDASCHLTIQKPVKCQEFPLRLWGDQQESICSPQTHLQAKFQVEFISVVLCHVFVFYFLLGEGKKEIFSQQDYRLLILYYYSLIIFNL